MDKNCKVILLNCPRIWPRLPPLGLASLAGYLNSNGARTQVIDLNQYFYSITSDKIKQVWEIPVNRSFSEQVWDYLSIHHPDEKKKAIDYILSHNAKIIGLSVWHSNGAFAKKIAELIKKIDPSKKIVVGGPEITLRFNADKNSVEEFFPFADHYIIGEGEKPLLNIFTNTDNNKFFVFDEIENLDSIPPPDFSFFDQYKYKYRRTLPLWMNKGCINRCAFCVEHTLTKKFRSKNPLLIVKEIKHFHLTKGIRHFVFYDSLMNGNMNLFEKFLDHLIKENLPVTWESQILIRNEMSEKIFKKMKQSGCVNIFVGLESGSDYILKLMKKKFTTKDASRFFRKCHNANLHFEISMILGFPGETQSTFKQTCAFLSDNAHNIPKLAQLNPFQRIAGSEIVKKTTHTNPQNTTSQTNQIINICREKNIRYTPAYINNLQQTNNIFDPTQP